MKIGLRRGRQTDLGGAGEVCASGIGRGGTKGQLLEWPRQAASGQYPVTAFSGNPLKAYPKLPHRVSSGFLLLPGLQESKLAGCRRWRRRPPVHSIPDWHSLCAFRLHLSNHRSVPSLPSKRLGGPSRPVITHHNRARAASAVGVMGIEIAAAGAKLAAAPNCRSCRGPWREVRVDGYLEVSMSRPGGDSE